MMRHKGYGLGALAFAVLMACGPSPEEVDQIKSQQDAILSKIADLGTKLDKVASAPAAPARPTAPDANKVYKIPDGNSPIQGDPNAKVAIVEFADFQ